MYIALVRVSVVPDDEENKKENWFTYRSLMRIRSFFVSRFLSHSLSVFQTTQIPHRLTVTAGILGAMSPQSIVVSSYRTYTSSGQRIYIGLPETRSFLRAKAFYDVMYVCLYNMCPIFDIREGGGWVRRAF